MKKWTRWQDWVTVVAGAVVALATIWVTPAGGSFVLMLALGVLLVAAGLVNLAMPGLSWMEWVHGVIGVLLFVSPWAGLYATQMGAAWFSWIGGGVVIVVTALELIPSFTGHERVAHAR